MCSCFGGSSDGPKKQKRASSTLAAKQDIPPISQLIESAVKAFTERFGSEPTVAAQAPGRVNLIGEHTDYNEGFVLPTALPMVTVIVGCPTTSGTCRVETLSAAADSPKYTEFPIDALKKGAPRWCNYVIGVAAQMKGILSSFDAVIATSVPLGGGVSSSASLEVATYMFLEQIEMEAPELAEIDKILMCQKAEHEFADVPCGIMDQYISMTAKAGHALLLDCRSQKGKLIPMTDTNVVVLVTNSHIKHDLSGSEYPTRKRQCQEGAKALGVSSLREATVDMLEAKKGELDPETFRRVRHVITEIKRTEEAAEALEKGDYETFGKHMVDSHNSLRDDYEVSCIELDQLVEFAMEMKDQGVYGSRMTGGGFGGCTVTLVQAQHVDKVINHIGFLVVGWDPIYPALSRMFGTDKYKEIGKKASFFVCPPSDGAKKISL